MENVTGPDISENTNPAPAFLKSNEASPHGKAIGQVNRIGSRLLRLREQALLPESREDAIEWPRHRTLSNVLGSPPFVSIASEPQGASRDYSWPHM